MACAQNIDLFQEQRRLQGQTMAEQEVVFGSKPSLLKIQSGKRSPRLSSGGGSNRGLSAAGTMPQTPKDDSLLSIKGTHNTHEAKKNTSMHTKEQLIIPMLMHSQLYQTVIFFRLQFFLLWGLDGKLSIFQVAHLQD